jgi:hypothetical protein
MKLLYFKKVFTSLAKDLKSPYYKKVKKKIMLKIEILVY